MRSILIVDDEPAVLRIVSLVLRDFGCDTHTAPDAETALRLLEDVRPDVIITDVRLPGIDGVELTRRVKSNAELAATPVLLVSAYGEPRSHGGDGFIAKPFDIDELVALLTAYLPPVGASVDGARLGNGVRSSRPQAAARPVAKGAGSRRAIPGDGARRDRQSPQRLGDDRT